MEFTDAQEMAKKHPKTFFVPDAEDLNNLKEGDIVKVATCGERFWTVIEEIDEDGVTIKAKVDNDLVGTEEHGLKCGDSISFNKRHVYSIW